MLSSQIVIIITRLTRLCFRVQPRTLCLLVLITCPPTFVLIVGISNVTRQVQELRDRIHSLADSKDADTRINSDSEGALNSASSDSIVWSSSGSSHFASSIPNGMDRVREPSFSSPSTSNSRPNERVNWKEVRRKSNNNNAASAAAAAANARPVQSDGGGIPGGGLVPRKRDKATRANAAAMVRGSGGVGKGRGSKDG